MDIYAGFADSYDLFMENVPYDEWSKYLVGILKKNGIEDGLVLELGCGTGNITERLASAGYDMIGIDCSDDMLNVALDKKYDSGYDILYLNQDMREFELYGTVRAIVSICDSMNYILKEEELVQVFKLVNNYLDPEGLFVFDMNTIAKYEAIGDTVIAENREDASFIWENTYFADTNINQYDLTIFAKGYDGRYDKYEETHQQRAYTVDKIKELIEKAGMEFVAVYAALTDEEPSEDCERVYILAREHGKKII